MVSVASFLLFFLYGTVSQSTSRVPGQILIHAFLPDRVLCLMAFLMLHVAFMGLQCLAILVFAPVHALCLGPWNRGIALRFTGVLAPASEPTLTIYTDSFLTFFILHLRSLFFFFLLLFFFCSLKHSYPLLFFLFYFFSVHFRQNGPYPEGRFGWRQSFFGYW